MLDTLCLKGGSKEILDLSLKGDIAHSVKTVLYKKVHRSINILNSMIFKSTVIWKIMQAFEIELKVSIGFQTLNYPQ